MVAAFAFADQVNTDADRIRDCGYGNNLHGETQRARNVNDRIHCKKNREQRDTGATNRGDSQPDRRTGPNRAGAKDRNREHHEVNDPVKNIGGVVHQLKRFLNTGADLTRDRNHERGRADENDRIDGRFVSRV